MNADACTHTHAQMYTHACTFPHAGFIHVHDDDGVGERGDGRQKGGNTGIWRIVMVSGGKSKSASLSKISRSNRYSSASTTSTWATQAKIKLSAVQKRLNVKQALGGTCTLTSRTRTDEEEMLELNFVDAI